MEYLRTPDECFQNLPDFPFTPHYLEINGLRLHYLDEGPPAAAPRSRTQHLLDVSDFSARRINP